MQFQSRERDSQRKSGWEVETERSGGGKSGKTFSVFLPLFGEGAFFLFFHLLLPLPLLLLLLLLSLEVLSWWRRRRRRRYGRKPFPPTQIGTRPKKKKKPRDERFGWRRMKESRTKGALCLPLSLSLLFPSNMISFLFLLGLDSADDDDDRVSTFSFHQKKRGKGEKVLFFQSGPYFLRPLFFLSLSPRAGGSFALQGQQFFFSLSISLCTFLISRN